MLKENIEKLTMERLPLLTGGPASALDAAPVSQPRLRQTTKLVHEAAEIA